MTTAQVVETSVPENNNSPIQDHVYPDDHTQPTYLIAIIIMKSQNLVLQQVTWQIRRRMIFASVVVLIDDFSEHENMLTLINDVINMSKHGTKKKSE